MKKVLLFIFSAVLSMGLWAQELNDFPWGGKRCEKNSSITSDYSGKVVKSPEKLPSLMKNSVVVEINKTYFFENEDRTSTYEMIYFDVKQTAKKGAEISSGDELGKAMNDVVYIIVRSKTIDPYLVSVNSILPVKVNGFYYWFPGMLANDTMKYLDYSPLDLEGVKWMYNHTTNPDSDPDWTPGYSSFRWQILMETSLKSYPKKLKENAMSKYGVPIESELTVEYEGMQFSLAFQPQFLDYLKEEYKLKDKIYLYLVVDGIGAFDKTFSCYVRDFSLISPTEIVKRNMNTIKERLGE
ncbi:MAG: hypothetical protein MJ179_11525 [Treponema sp.]|nr:hypothetical protein [Treponema sp.]